MKRSRGVSVAIIAAFALATSLVRAQGSDREKQAEALFDEAMSLVERGKFADACPRFEKSLELDPGLGTQFNLADCYEHVGRRAKAWAHFSEVARLAHLSGKEERERLAKKRAAALFAALPKLVVRGPASTEAVSIRVDGVVVTREDWGEPHPIDPGAHVVEADAPGREPFRVDAHLGDDAKTTEIVVPELEQAPAAPAPVAAPSTPRSGLGAQRIAAIGVGAMGITGLALGSVFGVSAFSGHDKAKEMCPDPNACSTREGANAWADATAAGDRSTVAFLIGGVAVGAALVLWITSGTSAPRSAAGHPARVGLVF